MNMENLYIGPKKKKNSFLAAIIFTTLIWAYIITLVQAVLIFQNNPEIILITHRIYLFFMFFFSNIFLFIMINLIFSVFFLILNIRVYQEYYKLTYTFFILFSNTGFMIVNYYRIGRGTIVDFFNAGFILFSAISLLLLAFLLIIFLLSIEKPYNKLPFSVKAFALFLFTVLGFYFLLAGARYQIARPEKGPGEAYIISETENKVIFLAIDALNWTVLRPMLNEDRLPNFQRLYENGASFELETIEPAKSPVVWTSIYTSMKPEEHGILDFSLYKMPFMDPVSGKMRISKMTLLHYMMKIYEIVGVNRIIIYNSTHRRSKAIWDILTEKDVSSSVLGGWVTYPVYPITGNMVSPQFTYSVEDLFITREHVLNDVYPAELADFLKDCIIDPRKLSYDDIAYYVNVFIQGFENLANTRLISKNLDLLKWITAQDETFFCIAKKLWEKDDHRFRFLYFQQTDVLSHQFWHYFQPEYFSDIEEKEMRVFKDVIFRSYEKMDEYLGFIMNNYLNENTLLIVASDHGMLPTGSFVKSGDHLYGKPAGALFLYGEDMVSPASKTGLAHIYDIAPTILYVLGFPYAEDFSGIILRDSFLESVSNALPVIEIKSYGERTFDSINLLYDERQEAALEHLRSLGYIQ